MKLKPLNRLLLCACLLSPCLVAGGPLRAQDQAEAAPEKQEKEQKKEKEYKTEKSAEAKNQLIRTYEDLARLREKIQLKKGQKLGAKIPFLGVVLGPVDESLGSQLGLPDGIGVLVRAVMDDSPAAKGGVMQHDVLHYFNDQLLVNEAQLQTLVQQAGIGSEVKITLFRKGKSEVMTARLGETLEQAEPREERDGPPQFHRGPASPPLALSFDHRPYKEMLAQNENLERELRAFQEKMQKHRGDTDEVRREIERFTARMQELQKAKQGVLFYRDKNAPDPKIQVQVLTDGEAGAGSTSATLSTTGGKDGSTIITHSNTTRAKWKNDQGSGELTVENGKKELTVKDAEGREIYSGPLDTKEQRVNLPPHVREQLERIEQGLKLEVRPALPTEATKTKEKDS
jgi:hypothetical protein